MNNRDKLIDLLVDNELSRFELAEMLKVTVQEIDSWLSPIGAVGHTDIPDMAIELLELKIKQRDT
ncbi:MAG: hypothetical protein L0Y67_07490 [Gammaproteobacteria bacterium]|nr:hypothetical protein [Gammaproteobacteria bacterium]MCI0591425.1 hypothetical protein [Gammaproteobacteria bacterium]